MDSAGVTLAGQARLACPPGFIRETRYRESGALSEQGMFLFLKNTVAVLKHPAKPRADTMCSGQGPPWGRGGWEEDKHNDKKIMKLAVKTFYKCTD